MTGPKKEEQGLESSEGNDRSIAILRWNLVAVEVAVPVKRVLAAAGRTEVAATMGLAVGAAAASSVGVAATSSVGIARAWTGDAVGEAAADVQNPARSDIHPHFLVT